MSTKKNLKLKIKKNKEALVGGLGDNAPDSDFDPKQLKAGIEDESGEHTKSKKVAKEIAKDHLKKDKEYYVKAKKAGLEEKWSEKYKKSIDCKHPKGFSQKAHCQGRKKLDESYELLTECDCGCDECQVNSEPYIDLQVIDVNPEVDEEFDEYEGNTVDFVDSNMSKGNPDLDMDGIYSPEELYYHFDLDDDGAVEPEEYEEHVEWHADHPEYLDADDEEGAMPLYEVKDRCYYLAKQKYDVFPSAYASGFIVRCRKGKVAKKKKVNESSKYSDNLKKLVSADQKLRNKFAKMIDAEGGWSEELVKKFVKIYNTKENDVFGSENVERDLLSLDSKLDFENFDETDWDNYWLLSQHMDKYPNFQKKALSKLKQYRGEKDPLYKKLLFRLGSNKGVIKTKEGETVDLDLIDDMRIEWEDLASKINEGTFDKEKSQGLHGWFARKGGKGKSKGWVDCNTCRKDPKTGRKTCKTCGRQSGEKRSKYPACRPTPSACNRAGTSKKKSSARVSWKVNEAIETYRDAGKSLRDVIEMPYEQFIVNYNQIATDSKVRTLLKYGRKDGKPTDEVVRFRIVSIPVSQLIPTQNEIDVKQSLFYTLYYPEKAQNCLQGKDIEINNKLLVTAEGKYIIDGHHRWSSVYCLNPEATIRCLDMEFPQFDPMDYLKITQLAIAADKTTLAVSKVQGSNLLTIGEDEAKEYSMSVLSEETVQMFSDYKNMNTQQEIVDHVWENISLMQQNNQPVKGAPKRSFMPQTDTSNNWGSFLKNGEVNFIEPDVLKSDLKEHYMRILKEYHGDVPQAVEKMYIFDFDDTIAETHSMVYVKDTRDNTERPMNSVEFRSYKKLPHEQFDFREFAEVVDPKELEQVIKAFSDILLAMKDAESQERVFLCILTARGPQGGRTSRNIKNYLKDLFTKFLTGIDREDLIAEWNDILENFTVEALGANRAEDKSRWILDKANLFPNLKKVVFYDDAPKNREAFEMMQDELQMRGVETIAHDPAGYTYDPEHLEEDKETKLEENKIFDRMKVLAGIKKNR